MYLRTITRKNKDGSVVRYLQLAHNVRNPKGYAEAKVAYSFGREDQLDREALARLVRSISRFLEPGGVLEASADQKLSFVSSRPLGGSYVLDALWRELGIDVALKDLLRKRRFGADIERVIFALVANRALCPTSKLAASAWATEDTVVDGIKEMTDDHAYRAMDFLLQAEEAIEKEVFFSAANILNLEVDLLFFDTTSTYFETEEEDDFRRCGHTKDNRPDLPQVIVGLAVTREGVPVRSWTFAGNTTDVSLIQGVKDDLRDWKLGRVVMVVDRGFTSQDNLRYLQRAGGHYIAGERMRSGTPETKAALSRAGRYQKVADGLKVKEIVVGGGEARRRYIVCANPTQAERDRSKRQETLVRLEGELASLGQLKGGPHKKAACALRAHPSLGRYLKQRKDGVLTLDRAKVKAEERLDGKFLLSTSDDTLSATDVALGYKQLAEVERSFKDLKHTLELRPIRHTKKERIRAHITLCFLALLLVRVAEVKTGMTWRNIKRELGRLHLGTFRGPTGTVLQRTEITAGQKAIMAALKVKEPPKFYEIAL